MLQVVSFMVGPLAKTLARLVPSGFSILLSFLSALLLHIPVPFVKTCLQGRLCELMPLSFRLDPAQVLSD